MRHKQGGKFMNIVSRKQYYGEQVGFMLRHPISLIDTSPMCDNSYSKTYLAEDGATMWECRRIVTETVEVEVRGTKTKVDVKLWENECWSTEFGSMYYYERAN